MQVLYKEMKTFDQLEAYIQNHIINQVFSNVAISCAIHDQQLDEKMDIENKTTTNILAFDFCKQQGVGKHFKGNQDQFNQFQVVGSIKEHFELYRATYDLLEDSVSKDNYFSLLMFLLCPYTNRFFAGRLEEDFEVGSGFAWLGYKQLKQKRVELAEQTKGFSVTLGASLVDFVEIPLFIQKIHKDATFTLELYSGENQTYVPVLTVELKDVEPVEQWEEKPVDESEEKPEEKLVDQWEETPVEESKEKPVEESKEKPVEESQEKPVEESQEKAAEPSEAAMTEEDLSAVLASLPKAVPAAVVTPEKQVEKRVTAHVDLESLQKSIELLSTMEELVVYLHKQYPTNDPLCTDLLNSMLSGVQSIRSTLRKHELDF